jgi:hypothetical protein
VLDDRQSEPGPAGRSATGRIDPVETVEDAGEVLGGDTDAVVDNFQHRRLRIFEPDIHRDLAAGWRVADAVFDQVRHHLPQSIGLAKHADRFKAADPHSMVGSYLAKPLDDVTGQILKLHQLQRSTRRDLLAGEEQDVRDEPGHSRRFGLSLGGHFLAGVRMKVSPKQVQVGTDHGQRVA